MDYISRCMRIYSREREDVTILINNDDVMMYTPSMAGQAAVAIAARCHDVGGHGYNRRRRGDYVIR